MAEGMFRERALRSGAPLRVRSAGFAAEGWAPPKATLAAVQRLGVDLREHRSRTLTPEMLNESDLVIGMTRAHVWEAVVMVPEVLSRAFVIGELDRLNREIGGRLVGESLEHWLHRVHERRNFGIHHVLDDDEVPDPYGRRRGVHRKVARQLHELVLHLGDCAFVSLDALSQVRWQEGRLVWRPVGSNEPT